MPQSWFSFKNAADSKSVEISIYDVIGGYNVNAKTFIAELKRIGNKDVTLRIHSPGGNILEGNAIYNALKRHAGSIDVVIDGIAASMASVVAMAGDTIEIAENGLIMIHNPSTYGGGDSRDMRKMAEVMDKMKENIITAYERKTGLSRAKLAEMMDDETWMTANEALENQFVDLIGDKVEAKNSFDLSQFKNSARAVDMLKKADAQTADTKTTTTNSMDLTAAQNRIKELEDAAKNWEAVKAGLEKAKTDAEAKATKIEGELKTANDKIVTIEAELKEASDKVTKVEGELKTATDKVTKVEGELKTEKDQVTKLAGEAKSADERAREIAARHGVELPPKAPGAGNRTIENADTAGLTGMAKARAYLAGRQPNKKD
jgi:ATP-dependent protease ClpP protease subunit